MFTGIVEELGTVQAITPNSGGARIEIAATQVLDDAEIGASIAVNGCCLTVVALGEGCFAADAVTETLSRTELGTLEPGDRVNLERPVRLQDRLGGHLVQGHVDAVGTIRGRTPEADGSERIEFAAPEAVMRYIVEKGSITVDGISLTVAALSHDGFDGRRDPAHARGDDAGYETGRRRGEPRSRHRGQVRGTFTGPSRRLRNPTCRSQRSSKPSRPSHAARSSSSSTTPIARTRATSSWRPRR